MPVKVSRYAPSVPSDVVGSRFAWRESGSPSQPTLVLLHGLGGSRLSWEPQLSGLADRFRVVAWDMPGYGESKSRRGPVTFNDLAKAVVAFVDELGATTVHLAGISFGAMIAQYAAATYPTRFSTLTLMATSAKFGLDGTDPAEWRAARLAPLDEGKQPSDFGDAVLRGIAGPNIAPDALAGQIAAMSRVSAGALRRSIDCLITHDSRDLLSTIAIPTLCIVGELDEETPPAYSEYLAENLRDGRLAVVPGAGHLVNVEAPDAVNELLVTHTGVDLR
jgi:3-oxoadipate enol-lactonase